MALAPGSSLGPYEVLAPLGAGGMGEVYRARDPRLDRDVALKILPAGLSADPDRHARFEREAKAVAALSHPNILAIHDFGVHEGTPFAAMELLDGKTLRQRLAEDPLTSRKSIEIALQVAAGLAAAHSKGIVHRDLKPENVFLTRDGLVKILDFGLAKLQGQPEAGGASAAPTVSAGTAPGIVMGTVGYMAPEQVRGLPADHRADIFAFGTILYEMLAGTRAFTGPSTIETMNAILREEPSELPAAKGIPPVLDRIVRRCLEKSPDERFQSARDLGFALQAVSGSTGSTSTQAVIPVSPRATGRARAYAVGGLTGAAVATAVCAGLYVARPAAPAPARRVVRFAVEVPAGRTLGHIALAPDGSRLVYVGIEGGTGRVYARALDQSHDTVMAGTDGATSAFFSPDSQWIAFFAGGRLRKVPAGGGDAVSIADVPPADLDPTGTWTDDDSIVFSAGSSLLRVPAGGGVPVSVAAVPEAEAGQYQLWPEVLPDGQAALVTLSRGGDNDATKVVAVPLAGGPSRPVIPEGASARLLPTGHLAYAASGRLMAARFDARDGSVSDSPIVILDQLAYKGKQALFDISAAGDLAFAEAHRQVRELLRVDRQGLVERLDGEVPEMIPTLSLSPDGTRLAGYFVRPDRRLALWMMDLTRGALTQVQAEASAHVPVWLPDGHSIAFSSDRDGAFNLYVQSADGSGSAERLTTSPLHQDPASWSRDGLWLAYVHADPKTRADVRLLDRTTGQTMPLRQTPADERWPALSPDGRWIAYTSDESGHQEVYAEAAPRGGSRVQVSIGGGFEPVWSADGRELYYRQADRLMMVKVATGSSLSVSPPARLFEGAFGSRGSYAPASFAVAPDGEHFYFVRDRESGPVPRRIHVVANWLDEFKRRVAK